MRPQALTLAGYLAGVFSFCQAIQAPFESAQPTYRYGSSDHINTPTHEISLQSLSEHDFTTFSHPGYPSYGLRMKKLPKDFCETEANSYSGYLDVGYGSKHLFFYFFESRNDPNTDDVVMWVNGGSSMMGLYLELGPCSIVDPSAKGLNATKWNPHSWNENTNLFFLDQPVGIGFSYADYGQTVATTEDAAKDVNAFISLFFETFSQFKDRPFHMAGESYGGRYLPIFASAVHESNQRATAENRTTINLKSILIGNPYTDPQKMVLSYWDMLCTRTSLDPILDISTCVSLKRAMPRCSERMKKDCEDHFDAAACDAAMDYCTRLTRIPLLASGKNPYDLSKDCVVNDVLCDKTGQVIAEYLNQPWVQDLLGVEQGFNYSWHSEAFSSLFKRNFDTIRPTNHYVEQLLERGIQVLIYVGTYDWICNWIGNYAWVRELNWSGHGNFAAERLREWRVDGKVVGEKKSANGLTWATIYGAGHMVPYNKPVQSLAMVQRYLKEEPL